MTPDEAALSLRDDPTFALMSREEQETEAAFLVGDDPLDVALAIEAALSGKPPPESAGALSHVEPCREGNERCVQPVSGTGRCMTCGAYRDAAPLPVIAVPDPLPSNPADLAPPERETAVEAPNPPPKPQSAPRPVSGQNRSITYRIKLATGLYDKEIAGHVRLSRPTVQAYAAGRLNEAYTAEQREALAVVLERRRDAIDDLVTELRS